MATQSDHKLTRFSETRAGRGLWIVDYSPEKAGVGGSTPSLATMFSITRTSRISLFGCKLLQFLAELQLILLLRLLSFSTTRC